MLVEAKLATRPQHPPQLGERQQETTKAVDVVEAGAQRTAGGVSVVEKTREAFRAIGSSVEGMTARIEQIAAAAHGLAGNAEQLNQLVSRSQINKNANSTADIVVSSLDPHHAWRKRLQEAIETGKSSTSVEDAGRDDGCTFGKWLHRPDMFRDREPERWQQLHDLHEKSTEMPQRSSTPRHPDKPNRPKNASRPAISPRSNNNHETLENHRQSGRISERPRRGSADAVGRDAVQPATRR